MMMTNEKTAVNAENETSVDSPCIRNCCLDSQDICVGCFRHLEEITQWRELSSQQKLAVLTRCRQRAQSQNRL